MTRLESSHLHAHLGRVTEGGVIEGLESIGAASVLELVARSPIDIGLAVWPFPLTLEHKSVVTSLGYVPVGGYEDAPEQRFFHADKNVQLFFVGAGSLQWTNYLLVRGFLRHSESARRRFLEFQTQPNGDKAAFFAALLEDAEVWWTAFYGFSPLEAVAKEFDAFTHLWVFSSGWALDLFLGRVTRVHHDVDVVVSRTAIRAVREHMNARGWQLVLPLDGRLEPWPPESPLEPDIQIHAHREGAIIDLLLTEMNAETWIYRRDPQVTCPMDRASLRTEGGIPFLAPELVLLFKSKNTGTGERSQDQRDFNTVYPHLNANRKAWLCGALTTTDPDHPWLERL